MASASSLGVFFEPGKLIPLLDNAYQGYASGHLAKDGYSQKLNLNCKERMHHPDTLTLEPRRTKKVGKNGGLPRVAWSSSLQLGLICTVSSWFSSEPPLTAQFSTDGDS